MIDLPRPILLILLLLFREFGLTTDPATKSARLSAVSAHVGVPLYNVKNLALFHKTTENTK